MIRKLLLTIVATLSFVTLLTSTAPSYASTSATVKAAKKKAHYHVYYRESNRDPWRLHSTQTNHGKAHQIAENFKKRGLQAKVVHHD